MSEKRAVSRRQFLLGAAAAVGGATLLGVPPIRGDEPPPVHRAYLPYLAHGPANPPAVAGQVIHVHAAEATHWDGEDDYWNHIDQDVVNSMVDNGLMQVTGASTVVDAWQALIPAYQQGQKIAVKVNLNNSWACTSPEARDIDALMQPVNAVTRGLMEIGVSPADVCVYDAVRAAPDHFVNADLWGVSFYDGSKYGVCRRPAGFGNAPQSRITFHHPGGVTMPDEYVTDVLMNAAYLINMPIMKGSHTLAGVTLGFKCHFGTISNCSLLHDFVNVMSQPPGYRTDYNPLVDLLRSPLIGGKTVLTIGDGLFAARVFHEPPVPWTTFGHQVPNSLFFSRDPVAIDCVMHDFLAAEPGTNVPDGANNYLRLAAQNGLGVFEEGNPWQEPYGAGYSSIKYSRVEL